MNVRYFDHAASSWPKPPKVIEAMSECVLDYAANPGRGSHKMAIRASRTLFEARRNLALLFKINNPNDISFTLNTTGALNQAIKGFLKRGDHVICTGVEHNSVRRPLEYVKRTNGVELSYLNMDEKGNINLDEFASLIRSNTTLVVCNHSSNLLGSILPIEKISGIIKTKNIKLLVDAAQTAGTLPIDVGEMGIDMLAFPGHKGLLGPQGTGGLYIHPEIDLEPFMHGGTGTQSEEIEQPTVRPERYEAGTQNTPGIAGLNEGVKYVLKESVEQVHKHEWNLTQRIMSGLKQLDGIHILGPDEGVDRSGIVSFRLNGIDPSEVAFILDQSFQIAVRSGFHCSPLAHQTAGTFDTGAIRASVGYDTSEADADYLLHAMKEISGHYYNKGNR